MSTPRNRRLTTVHRSVLGLIGNSTFFLCQKNGDMKRLLLTAAFRRRCCNSLPRNGVLPAVRVSMRGARNREHTSKFLYTCTILERNHRRRGESRLLANELSENLERRSPLSFLQSHHQSESARGPTIDLLTAVRRFCE